ncbi:unnamed protein product [Plutella xylostella]|uniref:(diamondback moth) hypothetical protein n=1 Tax=Plutella xylostella TaxID=51655 RepID=A0A8S4DD41_PLUXY|nr:unnamed protein product [Plutella xylostella]
MHNAAVICEPPGAHQGGRDSPRRAGGYTREVERLLREYRQNQELVRNIGAHYYQIIYPVQLRHHEKMGISTREVNTQKGRGYGSDYQQGTRARTRELPHVLSSSIWWWFDEKPRTEENSQKSVVALPLCNKRYTLERLSRRRPDIVGSSLVSPSIPSAR